MRILRVICLIPVFTLQGIPAMAATEFEDSIPLDVAEALFDYGNTGRFAVYSDIMDEFPTITIPDDFTVLGSAFFINSMRVALSTELEIESAVQAIQTSLIDDGWETMPTFNPRPNQTGFVSAAQIDVRNRTVCHDEFGQLSITSRSVDAGNQIILSASGSLTRDRFSCAQLRAQMEQQMTMMQSRGGMGFQHYLPRLVVPESATTGRSPAVMLGGMSSSSNGAESDMELEIDWDMEEVYKHFAEQMAGQDWTLDTESIGSVSASGTWTQSPEDNMSLVGTINVVNAGEDRFQLKLSVEALGGGSNFRVIRSN